MLDRLNIMSSGGLNTAAFAAGLLNPAMDKPEMVTGPNGAKADKRYNVYRNNVTVSLINAVADIFPAIERIVGGENFKLLARSYVRSHPPKSPLLFLYGQDFAEFIEQFEPAKHLPYLGDVARIERAWLTAYHAADLEPLNPVKLGEVYPERLGDLTFKPHPATGFVQSAYPVHDIFLMNRGYMDLAPLDMNHCQSILITRPNTDTRIALLDEGEQVFFQDILAGKSLGDAAVEATEKNPKFDLNASLQMLLVTGATTDILLDEREV